MEIRQEKMLCHYALNYLRDEIPSLKKNIEEMPDAGFRDHLITLLQVMERDLVEVEKMNEAYY